MDPLDAYGVDQRDHVGREPFEPIRTPTARTSARGIAALVGRHDPKPRVNEERSYSRPTRARLGETVK
jgi:hypothetical protein